MTTKVIFHIDEANKWEMVIANLTNLCKSIDTQDAAIELLANSNAVLGYKKESSAFKNELMNLSRQGVQFCACNNSLTGLNISSDELFEFISIVPVGVKELIDRQAEGFAYIRP